MTKVIEALRRVRVADPVRRVHDYPRQMSGGMKQRVVGAIAMGSMPKVLIADEPTTAIDVTIQAQYLRLLKDIQAETGLSIIFITHDFGVVARMCDRVAVMYAGRIVEIAPAKSLFDAPRNPYTQALFSAALPVSPDIISEEIILEGEVPSPIDPPSGCRFHPRCPFKVGDICEKVDPKLLRQSDDPKHLVACHRYGQAWNCTDGHTQFRCKIRFKFVSWQGQ